MCGLTSRMPHTEAQMRPNELRKRALGTAVAEVIDQAVKRGIWPSQPTSYAEIHALEVKAVLDDHNLTPIASEVPVAGTITATGERVTGRVDLVCRDQEGNLVILDVKTYKCSAETSRAQISMYYHLLSGRREISRIGLLLVPTTGPHIMGSITWITPMTPDEALEILRIRRHV